MASIQITKWDIAQALGLEYEGESEWDYAQCTSWFKFVFTGGKRFLIEQNGYDAETPEQAKERAAEKVLAIIGRVVEVML